MQIAIVEGNARDREALVTLLEHWCRERGVEAELSACESGDALSAGPGGPELALLGDGAEGLSALDAARRLRARDRGIQIVIVSPRLRDAAEGYAVDAAGFIAKPAEFPATRAAMDCALARLRAAGPRFLMTRYAKEPVCCQARQIVFIESLNKKTLIHMAGGETLRSSEPLYALEARLDGVSFFRCHNAYLVNLRLVQTAGAAALTAQGWQLPVSKYRKRELLQRLAACREGEP